MRRRKDLEVVIDTIRPGIRAFTEILRGWDQIHPLPLTDEEWDDPHCWHVRRASLRSYRERCCFCREGRTIIHRLRRGVRHGSP